MGALTDKLCDFLDAHTYPPSGTGAPFQSSPNSSAPAVLVGRFVLRIP